MTALPLPRPFLSIATKLINACALTSVLPVTPECRYRALIKRTQLMRPWPNPWLDPLGLIARGPVWLLNARLDFNNRCVVTAECAGGNVAVQLYVYLAALHL